MRRATTWAYCRDSLSTQAEFVLNTGGRMWDPWQSLANRRQELMESDIYTLRRIIPEDRGKKWD